MSRPMTLESSPTDRLPAMAPAADPTIPVGTAVAGLDPDALVHGYGSPLYVYDLDVVSARVDRLRAALPARVDLAYAVKANPNPSVMSRLAGLGLGADVASAGELRAAVAAGFDIRRIVVTGPGTTDEELAFALRLGVRAVTVESLDQVGSLLAMADLARPGQGLLLRLATPDAIEERPIIGAAGAAKFGMLVEEAEEAIDRLRLAGAIGGPGAPYELLGFHAFGASNVLDAERIVGGVRWLAARAEALAVRLGAELGLLDAGGGLGIPYAEGEPVLDLRALGDGLDREIDSWPRRAGLARARLVLEPGRYPVGPAGAYLMRVLRTKVRGDRRVVVVDGGIHHLLRPALVGRPQRIVSVGIGAPERPGVTCDVVGPLCTGLDVLATGVVLPEPRAGDLLAVLDAGAYGFTESMPLFLSHPMPAEVAISGDGATATRYRIVPVA
jgi:diaminopimelate decarboxylase